jgi:hypothetical protein
MSMSSDQDVIDLVTRTLQIIVAALITGVVVFLGISSVVAPILGAPPGAGGAGGAGPPAAAGPMDLRDVITWTAVAFAAVGLPLSFLLPGWMSNQNRRSIAAGTWNAPGTPALFGPGALESDTGKLAFVYQTQLIVGAAMNEGPAFFAVVAYMLGKNPIALGLAVLLLVAMVVRFPTRLRVASWIDRQQELLIQDRQAAF